MEVRREVKEQGKNRGWEIAITIFSWLILFYGILLLIITIMDFIQGFRDFGKPSITLENICLNIIGILLCIGGAATLKRKNWGRCLVVYTLLFHIPVFILFMKRGLAGIPRNCFEEGCFFYEKKVLENILHLIIINVTYCCVLLSLAFFFIYAKVKEEFK